jgi:transposase
MASLAIKPLCSRLPWKNIDSNHSVRVIDAFVERLDAVELGFDNAVTAETGRKPHNPKDLLKLFICGYLYLLMI